MTGLRNRGMKSLKNKNFQEMGKNHLDQDRREPTHKRNGYEKLKQTPFTIRKGQKIEL